MYNLFISEVISRGKMESLGTLSSGDVFGNIPTQIHYRKIWGSW